MEMFVTAASVLKTYREHPEDDRKSFGCEIKLQLQSKGEFPIDPEDPRGTIAAVQELLAHLMKMEVKTGHDDTVPGH